MASSCDVCAICLEKLTYNRRNIHKTPCGHIFHAICFRKITDATCPYCRQEVQHEPVRRIQMLKSDLDYLKYEEQHSALQQINRLDLQISNERIDYLKSLLREEMQSKNRIESTIRNTRLYYKYRRIEIKNLIKSARIEKHINYLEKQGINSLKNMHRMEIDEDDLDSQSNDEMECETEGKV
jgi:Ring finger domain